MHRPRIPWIESSGLRPALLMLATAGILTGPAHAQDEQPTPRSEQPPPPEAPALPPATDNLDARFDALQGQIDALRPRFSLNGYFTFTGGATDQRDGTFNETWTDNADFESQSRAAVQLEMRIADDTRFVTQLLAEGPQGWNAHAEWAFLAHDLTEDITVRAGRLRIPLFLYSETLDVGYTQPWVETPTEMYGLLSFSSYEGVDARFRFETLGADWSFQPFFGYAHLNESESVSSDSYGDEMHGFDLTANWDDLTARIGYWGSRMSIPSFPLADVANDINQSVRDAAGAGIATGADAAATGAATGAAIGAASGAAPAAAGGAGIGAAAGQGCFGPYATYTPACEQAYWQAYTATYTTVYNTTYDSVYASTYDSVYDSIYDPAYAGVVAATQTPNLTVEDVDTQFISAGLRYDNGNVFLLTEFAQGKIDGFFPDVTSCYGTVGYHVGKVMPHLTYSHVRVDDPEERQFTDPGGLFIKQAFALDQNTWTAGVRYDLKPGIAIKADASKVGDFAPGSSGQWVPDNPTAPLPDHFWLYRASLDIVF
jgi:hypothetical protein